MPTPPVEFLNDEDEEVRTHKLNMLAEDLYGRMLSLKNQDRPYVWDDFRIPMTVTKFAGASDPDFTAFRGSTRVTWFDKGGDEETFFIAQYPHAMYVGENLFPHVHWCPKDTGTGSVVWGLEYVWADIGQVFEENTTTISVVSQADGKAYKHQLESLPEINGGFITGVSSILVGRVFRDANNSADTYDEDAGLLEFDFHIKLDSLGSREETSK